MSMNILIAATRKITFKKKNGKRSGEVQTVNFDAWQTPTKATYEILAAQNPAQAYIDWILCNCSLDREVPVYEEDDIFGGVMPVGTEIINEGKEHVEHFRDWVERVEEEGFTVKFDVI
jgi:hypothetical protein